mmetsp:Transcript_69375/g.174841  ORF Transcript_69375/g.174841 Transcript_69375/m.174841 type:complete len:210 (-) Transcript_69375:815-1444(-)
MYRFHLTSACCTLCLSSSRKCRSQRSTPSCQWSRASDAFARLSSKASTHWLWASIIRWFQLASRSSQRSCACASAIALRSSTSIMRTFVISLARMASNCASRCCSFALNSLMLILLNIASRLSSNHLASASSRLLYTSRTLASVGDCSSFRTPGRRPKHGILSRGPASLSLPARLRAGERSGKSGIFCAAASAANWVIRRCAKSSTGTF